MSDNSKKIALNSITWKCRHLCLLIFINLHYRGIHAQIKKQSKQLSIWILVNWVVGWFPLKCTWFYAHTQYVKVLLQNKNIIKIVCALLSGVKILFHPLISEGLISLSKRQSVSEWVCVCVWMFPNSSETANPSDLKFWGMISLGMEKVLG